MERRVRLRRLIGLASLLGLIAVDARAEPVLVAASRDAFVRHDEQSQTWSIGNWSVSYTVGLARDGTLAAMELRAGVAAADAWELSGLADGRLNLGGRVVWLGQAGAGFLFRDFEASASDGKVQLTVVFEVPSRQLRISRHYACYSGAPVLETWMTVEALGGGSSTSVSEVSVWRLDLKGTAVNWITGLDAPSGEGPYARKRALLRPQDEFVFGTEGRSSDRIVPVVWLELAEGAGHFFGGIMWSGAWSFSVRKDPGPWAEASLDLGGLSTTVRPGDPFETPHGFFGMATGPVSQMTAGLRAFITRGVREGRPFRPLVAYNTWFAYGTHIDEVTLREEMEVAADLGVEVFVVDAGWYGSGRDPSDFTVGLGTWQVDTRRFPSGLRALGEFARSLGMRFGVWVEPERVSSATINRTGLVREAWLATAGGRYNPGVSQSAARSAQICLAHPDARRWALERLVAFIEEVQPDYLKWDNNFWINCDRPGHSHGPADGNFAHVRGLYEILASVRSRYPDLIVENCAGGGRRLDLGMLRFTDVAWMDDVTTPSARVRHHLEGLGVVFPPAYLLSFVKSHGTEPMRNGPNLSLYMRSRMPGMLGLTYVGAELDEDDAEQIKHEVQIYKQIRGILARAHAVLLTQQAFEPSTECDAMEAVSPATGDAVIFAFSDPVARNCGSIGPVGLRPRSLYDIYSVDEGRVGAGAGDALMQNGLEIDGAWGSAGQILILRRVRPSSP